MEHIIHLLIGFIVLSFLLKTGFYPRWGIWLSALVYTVFLICIGPWATEQSPTEINSLLASAPHILTLSVYVTLEASIMIAFCFNCFADTSKQRTLFQRTVTYILNFLSRTANGGHTNLSAYTVVLRFSGSQLRTDHRHLFSCCFYTDIWTEPTLEKHSRRTEITT